MSPDPRALPDRSGTAEGRLNVYVDSRGAMVHTIDPWDQPAPRYGIYANYIGEGRGVCPVCGNGLWPNQPPCHHRRADKAASDERSAKTEEES